jgi:hypothetical protein
MNRCLDADALFAVGAALDWEVAAGLRHLQTCEECRAQLELLCRVRQGFEAREPVERAVVERITGAVRSAAAAERRRQAVHRRWLLSLEGLLAGSAAVLAAASSGVRIESPAAALAGFLLGAGLMVSGTLLARRLPSLGAANAGV